ncbi:hypothetical protein NC652_006579 [Populus alba x Populus x berolinensis]|uniref:Uncharacterized protein n=1 Tax=Populus alba x Populus x berolinensis TaxID=444605 RepID=A0AAD6REN7_9ROSI|nr:hypothetical protein NC652_006579 [Populus alba x Populus x berolinensis]KAJ7007499.1 hypothetical protein NC653_006516 [Populus alba x Populus x berolinensis]
MNTTLKNGKSSNLSLTTSFLINNSPISPPSTRPASLLLDISRTVASDRVYNTSADALCVMANIGCTGKGYCEEGDGAYPGGLNEEAEFVEGQRRRQ